MLGQTSSHENTVVDIVTEIASREGVSPFDLPPLFHSVDPDTLDFLVRSRDYEAVSINFTYYGYDVTVDGDDQVLVEQDT